MKSYQNANNFDIGAMLVKVLSS
jgi:hypothetical protein